MGWNTYSISRILICIKFFEKTHEKSADNPPIKIYIDKIENRITI